MFLFLSLFRDLFHFADLRSLRIETLSVHLPYMYTCLIFGWARAFVITAPNNLSTLFSSIFSHAVRSYQKRKKICAHTHTHAQKICRINDAVNISMMNVNDSHLWRMKIVFLFRFLPRSPQHSVLLRFFRQSKKFSDCVSLKLWIRNSILCFCSFSSLLLHEHSRTLSISLLFSHMCTVLRTAPTQRRQSYSMHFLFFDTR